MWNEMVNNTEYVTELLIATVCLFSLLSYWLAISMGHFSKNSEFLETDIPEFSALH